MVYHILPWVFLSEFAIFCHGSFIDLPARIRRSSNELSAPLVSMGMDLRSSFVRARRARWEGDGIQKGFDGVPTMG